MTFTIPAVPKNGWTSLSQRVKADSARGSKQTEQVKQVLWDFGASVGIIWTNDARVSKKLPIEAVQQVLDEIKLLNQESDNLGLSKPVLARIDRRLWEKMVGNTAAPVVRADLLADANDERKVQLLN